MKIYLAGPMRNIHLFNFPAFDNAAKELRKLGHEVFNPAEADVEKDGFDPAKDKPQPMKVYMARDLMAVCESDAVVVLPGWQESKGANLEVHTARQIGIPVYTQDFMEVEFRKTILQEAGELIYGDRNAQYGDPNQDFKRTADMWTGLLQFKIKEGEKIRPQDVAWMMMLLKASRAQHADKRDNYVDAAGYAGCGWRCIENK